MKGRLLSMGASLAESHPYAWKIAWTLVHHLSFLLPHDRSYGAFKHFIAVRPEGLFLDIGANDGISVLSFRVFDRDYKIISLEPNRLLEPALQKIGRKDPHFEYRILGAGSRPDHLTFFVPVYRGVVLHTFTSSNEDQVLHAVGNSFGERVAARVRIVQVECDVVMIDSLDVEPSIIKIDAEGLDFEVLIGASETISRARPFIVVEVGWADIDKISEFLAAKKYVLLSYDVKADCFREEVKKNLKAESGFRNMFAVPEEAVADLPVEIPAA